jgi:hypothetical protein
VGKNLSYDGSTALVWGKPVAFRNDIIVMTGRFINIIKVIMYGEIIND